MPPMPPTEAPIETPDLGRRRALGLLAGAGLVTLVAACGGSDDAASTSATDATTATTAGTATTQATTATTVATAITEATSSSTGGTVAVAGAIPEETGGPFPADGTNGPNVLTEDGIVRSDITSSFGDSSGVAEGVPLTVELTIVEVASQTVMPGAAVYLWHCDRDGSYSQYQDASGANHLRGVQEADADGRTTFTSIFPAAYDGRWPHIHFKIFSALGDATNGRNAIRTTQLALPEDVCDEVYGSVAGYESSASNIDRTTLESDMVFRDGVDLQLATVTGSVDGGFSASLVVGI
jgi:protocatechuate 3,4-dioxygenase beta subunit